MPLLCLFTLIISMVLVCDGFRVTDKSIGGRTALTGALGAIASMYYRYQLSTGLAGICRRLFCQSASRLVVARIVQSCKGSQRPTTAVCWQSSLSIYTWRLFSRNVRFDHLAGVRKPFHGPLVFDVLWSPLLFFVCTTHPARCSITRGVLLATTTHGFRGFLRARQSCSMDFPWQRSRPLRSSLAPPSPASSPWFPRSSAQPPVTQPCESVTAIPSPGWGPA